jgi:hypothetical protein
VEFKNTKIYAAGIGRACEHTLAGARGKFNSTLREPAEVWKIIFQGTVWFPHACSLVHVSIVDAGIGAKFVDLIRQPVAGFVHLESTQGQFLILLCIL